MSGSSLFARLPGYRRRALNTLSERAAEQQRPPTKGLNP
jgi:hypothetical protein